LIVTAFSLLRFAMANADKWVFFDVDDVLVDTSTPLELALRKMTGLHLPHTAWPNHMFTELYGIGKERAEEMRAVWVQERVLETAQVFDGVRETFHEFADEGYRLGLITARAWHPKAREITEAMVNENGLPVEEIKLMGFFDSKADILRDCGLSIHGFIDDTARHAQGVAALGVHSVLQSRFWNQSAVDTPRVERIGDFPQWLRLRTLKSALSAGVVSAPKSTASPIRRKGLKSVAG